MQARGSSDRCSGWGKSLGFSCFGWFKKRQQVGYIRRRSAREISSFFSVGSLAVLSALNYNAQNMKASQNRKQTTATYDSLSRWYDLISGPAENKARQRTVELLGLTSADRVLEIGSGTGSSALVMEPQLRERGFVYALDLSIKMLQVAQRKLRRKEGTRQISLVCGDALQLPFASHSVTKIFMGFTLELFNPDAMGRLLRECARVLARNGRLAVLSVSHCQPDAPLIQFYELLHRRYPAFFDCCPILLRQTLESHGFRTLKAKQDTILGLPIESVLAEPAS
jgi:demethylmenaquinone methyltransferase/2-methoxy-6-polyprenyl-1,4-benzoquinol methylase